MLAEKSLKLTHTIFSMVSRMKGIAIVAIGLVVLLVVLLSGALNPLMKNLYNILMGTSNPTETNTEESTAPTISATPQPIRNITVHYSLKTEQSITYQGITVTPDPGNAFLKVTMKIENNGYENAFSTNSALFSATSNGTKYDPDSLGTGSLDDWSTVNVANGETFRGTIVFQVPETAASFTFGYLQPISVNRFTIVWTST